MELRDVLTVLSWVTAGAIHQVVETKDDDARAEGLALTTSQFFRALVDAVNKITEEENQKEKGAPAGATLQ